MASDVDPNVLPADLPVPTDDGAADHLPGLALPSIALPSTAGGTVSLDGLGGDRPRTVLYVYPMTGRPGVPVPDGWDAIPGARGCTPQSCAFRDHHAELLTAGASRVFGLSTQDTDYQREAVERLHLPFPLLSDKTLELTRALRLPTMEVAQLVLLKRLALVLDEGRITKAFYPVFPPDRNVADVLSWLRANPRSDR